MFVAERIHPRWPLQVSLDVFSLGGGDRNTLFIEISSHSDNQCIELIRGRLETSQPPPNPLIRRTLASMRRR
jgi:hypothetical protein